MRTVLDVLNLSVDYLHKKGVGQPRLQAEELLSQALKIKRLDLYLQFDRPLVDDEINLCRAWLQRRSLGEPLQYIRGQVEFFNCLIKVTPSVLIPRQETEILVEKIVKELEADISDNKVLWDVCSGSGCIGIAIKKRFPQLRVCLSDISKQALVVAAENARNNQVDVELVEGDLLAAFNGQLADFIVCNPPYITEKELPSLDVEVREHEPLTALISGETGLEFYGRLAEDLSRYLTPGGKVWLEIGTGQGTAVQKLFCAPCWKKSHIENDWSGHERFFSLEIE